MRLNACVGAVVGFLLQIVCIFWPDSTSIIYSTSTGSDFPSQFLLAIKIELNNGIVTRR